MLLGAIADDFTGASDLANTLAQGGMRTTLFNGINGAGDCCEAGVIALKTRSMPPQAAVQQSLAAARWLLDQGCQQILFKYCSTFDSTPQGNIGPVAEALLEFLDAPYAVVCPAFPANGRRVFMGHLFVGERLLNESGMQNHPLTPMSDPDLRRWLGRQTSLGIGLVPQHDLANLDRAFAAAESAGQRLIVVDATSNADLLRIGQAVAGHRLVTGGSGIALGLPQNFRDQGLLSDHHKDLPSIDGPAVALCGSCSGTSQQQVAQFLETGPGFAVDPADLLSGRVTAQSVAAWVQDQSATALVYSTAAAALVAAAQSTHGQARSAAAIEGFFGTLARLLVAAGYRRIVVGGGETSGAVVEALDLQALQIGREIDPGVPALVTTGPLRLGLALKSGNFGAEDFFHKAVAQVAQP